ncbi:MAG TPA: Hsp20/alpha crystallin family protein [Bryobacteraceae bacterium]|nr:Hsp20/alpha crystallin family protein [Bryobacteraceae bacterium]
MRFFPSETGQERRQQWPAVDIVRTIDGWLLRFELAGVRLEDVNLQLGRRDIVLSGVRRDHMLEQGCSFYSMEITYSRFERTVQLPTDLSGARFNLEYRDGILLVRITEAA